MSIGNYKRKSETKKFIQSYWAKRSEEFAKLRKAELQSEKYVEWEKEIVSKLPKGKKLSILDVGCGSGFFSVLLSRLGNQVTGIDITPRMIEQGKQMIENEKSQIELRVMDAENLEFSSGSFDVVIARNVTWNLPNLELAYSEWLRVLKKGGILLNYDAEHAKVSLRSSHLQNHAHNQLSQDEVKQCNQMYDMLPISKEDRPAFDIKILEELNGKEISIDFEVGKRIYKEEDEFYITAPMFGIFVRK